MYIDDGLTLLLDERVLLDLAGMKHLDVDGQSLKILIVRQLDVYRDPECAINLRHLGLLDRRVLLQIGEPLVHEDGCKLHPNLRLMEHQVDRQQHLGSYEMRFEVLAMIAIYKKYTHSRPR